MPKRSIKIGGITTSLFLEEAFWEELERRAAASNTTWTCYLRTLIDAHDTTGNRSAAVKELLLRELRADLNATTRSHDRVPSSSGCRSRWLVERGGIRERVEFDQPVIRVGRATDNDIVLTELDVEPHHLLLVFDAERWWAVDLTSEAGMRLNNKQVKVCPVPRRSELSVGGVEIIRV